MGYYDDPRFHIAWVKAGQGRHESARRLLEELWQERREEAGSHDLLFYLATTAHSEGDYAKAIRLYDEYMERAGERYTDVLDLRLAAARLKPLQAARWEWPIAHEGPSGESYRLQPPQDQPTEDESASDAPVPEKGD